MKRSWVLGIWGLSFAALGCGSDGSDSSSGGDTCSTDSLTLTIAGLPTGTAANVVVSGGASSSVTVVATKSLKLATGDYTIAANAVTVADPIVRSVYTATVSTDTAHVTCGGDAASVTVTYALVPSSNKLWLGSENSDSDTFGYASASLATSGDVPGDVTASTAGSLPGAFDRAGNLWVIDNTSSAVGVKRYDATTLAAGGEETPDITISGDVLTGGVPGASALAFDASGNLWVGISYAHEIARFPAATLTASSDTAAPDVELKAVTAPTALAFDVSGNLWVGSADDVLEFTSDQLAASGSPTAATKIDAQSPEPVVAPLSDVEGLAFDASGNLWVNYGGTIAELTSLVSGTVTPAIQVQADVLALPQGIAFDESGGLWTAYSAGEFCKLGADQLTSSGMVAPEVVISNASLGSITSPAFFPAPAKLGLYSSLD